MASEAEVMDGIKRHLRLWEFSGVVIWWTRLQSFKIKHFTSWIQGCPKGTPDFVVLIRNKELDITVLFIEAKSSSGKLRPEQADFRDRYCNRTDVLFCEIRHPGQVDTIMQAIGVDRIDELPETL